jgi:hypothetical protein
VIVLLGVVAVGVSAKRDHDKKETAKKAAAAAAAKKRAKAIATYKLCKKTIGDLIDSEAELSSRLDVGLNLSQYSKQVGDVSVAYNKIDFEDLNGDCLTNVGLPAEQALNGFNKLGRKWNACIQDIDCDVDGLQLGSKWEKYALKVEAAKAALVELNPES